MARRPKARQIFATTPPSTAKPNTASPTVPHFFRPINLFRPNIGSQAPNTVLTLVQAQGVVGLLARAIPQFDWSVPHASLLGSDLIPHYQLQDGLLGEGEPATWYVLKPQNTGVSTGGLDGIELARVVDRLSGRSGSPLQGLAGFYAEQFPPGRISYEQAYNYVSNQVTDQQVVDALQKIFKE